MLLIVKERKKLDFSMLTEVYADSIMKDGRLNYPSRSVAEQFLLAKADLYRYYTDVFLKMRDAFCAVWEEGGEYISALRVEPYKDGYLLSGLETAPQKRNLGYATTLLREVLAYLRKNQWLPVCCHVSRTNAASLQVHRACGFYEILDYAAYIDGTVSRSAVTLKVDK